MTCIARMTDAILDKEIERLAHVIADCERRYDAEYQWGDGQREFNQSFIKYQLEETIARWERAMNERRRRMGFWIAP
ncbi:hypothetical protein WKH24_21830 [Pantoea agglomerans]|uniref:hypothetical protein n=1 Tax=Enterobacter agglomerans TaxID=549 RepID=UPI003C7DEDBA